MSAPQGRDISRDPFAPRGPWRFGAAAAAHVLLVVVIVALASSPEVRTVTQDLVVRLIEAEPPKPQPAPAKLQPASPQPVRAPAPPPPVMTAAAEAPTPSNFAVAPQPAPQPQAEVVPAPAPVAVTAARFDADYLHNPKPAYPMFSRRNGEEGKVQLRVRVGADGLPRDVEVKQSSGFARLDTAAREAVLHWRFVPAKRGNDAVESWVGVPIIFSLNS